MCVVLFSFDLAVLFTSQLLLLELVAIFAAAVAVVVEVEVVVAAAVVVVVTIASCLRMTGGTDCWLVIEHHQSFHSVPTPLVRSLRRLTVAI